MQTYTYTVDYTQYNLMQLCDEIFTTFNLKLYKTDPTEVTNGYADLVNSNVPDNLIISLDDSVSIPNLSTLLTGIVDNHVGDPEYVDNSEVLDLDDMNVQGVLDTNNGGTGTTVINTAFNVNFGTTAGTALEGDKYAEIQANTAKVSNATHTGEVTGSGPLTVDKTAITNKDTVVAASNDYVLLSDTSDGGNLKKTLVSDIGGGSVSLPTTTKGDIIVHDGSEDVRLPVGTDGKFLVADSSATEGVKWTDALSFGGTLSADGVLTPAQITTASTDNYNPSGLSSCNMLRLSKNTNCDVTGLVAPTNVNQIIFVCNIGTSNITLINNSVSSTAANRFLLGGNKNLQPGEGIILTYDKITQRWRSFGINI